MTPHLNRCCWSLPEGTVQAVFRSRDDFGTTIAIYYGKREGADEKMLSVHQSPKNGGVNVMENKFIQDPWARIKTRNGLNADEVISGLQKSIRRGLVEKACEFAYEMYITSPELEEKMWRRLITISVEDIGMGNPNAAVLMNSLNQMRKEYAYADGDRPIFFIHAIRYLCESEKDRSSDLLKNIVIKGFAMGYVPEIPDYALDKHTVRGAAMGRGSLHFLNEASKVIPQKKVDNDYKERYAKILETYSPDKAIDSAFKFNPWQY